MTLMQSSTLSAALGELPSGFVRLTDVIPDLQVDLKYASDDNFVGKPLIGYEHATAVLTGDAARALRDVQAQLKPLGLGIKVFDAYRPQRTVDFFLQWAADDHDITCKEAFYPALDKPRLLVEGYLNSPSGHSRGSTVDLTLIRLSDNSELDMGTPFDFFGPQSWTDYSAISSSQKANRAMLQKIMLAHGFIGVHEEWWHFTLKAEPFPDTYFDFIAS
ncbi:M15 family metallopeptidase [Thalassolituus marinus]|nr:M15 family metallopeptidase [Thalassolituus marinus]